MGLITERTDLDNLLLQSLNTNTWLYDLAIMNQPFSISTEVTRPNDTTAYAVNDIVNNASAPTVLPTLDFGVGNANRTINIRGLKFIRNYALNLWAYDFMLYNANTIAGQNLADNQAFNPTYAEQNLKLQCFIPFTNQDSEHFNSSNSSMVVNTFYTTNYFATLDATGKLFLGIIVNTVFTPVAQAKATFNFVGVFVA